MMSHQKKGIHPRPCGIINLSNIISYGRGTLPCLIETKKQVPSMKVNKFYSICSAVYMFAAVVIMFGTGVGGIEFPSWVKQVALMVFMVLALWIPMAIKTENHKLRTWLLELGSLTMAFLLML